jgi:thiamine-monophosphate kinase
MSFWEGNHLMKTIGEIGEKKVIDIILSCLELPDMPIKFFDDVSALQLDKDKLVVLKTDMLVGKTDKPQGMDLKQAAKKAVIMNISDFAAKGVKPKVILVALGLPRNFKEEDIRQIGLGLNEAAREYDAFIIGGDTNESSDLIISCSLMGICDKQIIVERNGAKPGDIVAVTGKFGKTASGLKIILEDLLVNQKIRKVLVDAVLMPRARLNEGLALAHTGALTASIDSSDGLAWSLFELSDASDIGFRIDYIPLAPEVIEFSRKYSLNSWELGLYGGEEYELIVTIKPDLWQKAVEAVKTFGISLTRIGITTKEKNIEFIMNGEIIRIERRGWEHFKS